MSSPLRPPHVDDWVRLTRDIPQLLLRRGSIGVVRSTWFAPSEAYEVEFAPPVLEHQTRAMVLGDDLQVEESFAEISEPADVH